MRVEGGCVPAKRAACLRVTRPPLLATPPSGLPLCPAAACAGSEPCTALRAGFLASSAAFLRFTSSARPFCTAAGATALAGGCSLCTELSGRRPADAFPSCERFCAESMHQAALKPASLLDPFVGLSLRMEHTPFLLRTVAAVVGGFACEAVWPLPNSGIRGGSGSVPRTRLSVPTHAGMLSDVPSSACSWSCVGSRSFWGGQPASTCTSSVQ